jgi:hypothetical protein
MPETLVVESLVASAVDVTSAAVGAGTMAASEADRVGTSAPPTTRGEGSDLCTFGPQAAPGPQAAMEGTRSEATNTSAFTSAPHGRQRSLPTAATWMSSRRRRA